MNSYRYIQFRSREALKGPRDRVRVHNDGWVTVPTRTPEHLATLLGTSVLEKVKIASFHYLSDNMADASSSGNEGTLAAYLEKTDRLNDLVLKLLQKISGTESSQPEDEGGEHITDTGRRRAPNSLRHEIGSDGSNPGEFVTKEELMGLLNDKRSIEAVDGAVFQPPYQREIQSKPYHKGYHPYNMKKLVRQITIFPQLGKGGFERIFGNRMSYLVTRS